MALEDLVTFQEGKRFSISFIDSFLECGRRTLLSSMLRLPSAKLNDATLYGKACHEALKRINIDLRDGTYPCPSCKQPCDVLGPNWAYALKVPDTECPIRKMMMEVFDAEFDEPSQKKILIKYAEKGEDKAYVDGVLANLRAIMPTLIFTTTATAVPHGKILLVEDDLSALLSGYKVRGLPDRVSATFDGNILMDYKVRGAKPSDKDFPTRQMSLYRYLLKEQGIGIIGAAVPYLLKTKGGWVDTKFMDFRDKNNEALYNRTIETLLEDMDNIKKAIENRLFLRNRRSMFCPCEMEPYCENSKYAERTYKEVQANEQRAREQDAADERAD